MSKDKRLKLEREKLIELTRDIQRRYLKEGSMETFAYQMRLETYTKRISEIDEGIAEAEAKKEIKSSRKLSEMFNLKKLLSNGDY